MHGERKSYGTYIMGSLSGILYIGVTSSLPKRVFEHKFHRIARFTDKYNVQRVLYSESFDDVQKTISREKQLKGWRRIEEGRADRIPKPSLAGSIARLVGGRGPSTTPDDALRESSCSA